MSKSHRRSRFANPAVKPGWKGKNPLGIKKPERPEQGKKR